VLQSLFCTHEPPTGAGGAGVTGGAGVEGAGVGGGVGGAGVGGGVGPEGKIRTSAQFLNCSPQFNGAELFCAEDMLAASNAVLQVPQKVPHHALESQPRFCIFLK